MKVSQLIHKLKTWQEIHGNVDVNIVVRTDKEEIPYDPHYLIDVIVNEDSSLSIDCTPLEALRENS